MADRSVRIAWSADSDAIGGIQARSWAASYAELLPSDVLSELDPVAFAAAWKQAIDRPPSARHRVLVALDGDRVVGFAATAPSEAPDAAAGKDGEIVAFLIDAADAGQGHGSRLLAASIDTLRADGFRRAEIWLLSQDDALRRFFTESGWGPDGAHRTLDLDGDGTTMVHQVRLHSDVEVDQ